MFGYKLLKKATARATTVLGSKGEALTAGQAMNVAGKAEEAYKVGLDQRRKNGMK